MTRPKISKSERTILRNSSGVLPTGIDLMSLIRLSTTGERMALATSVMIFSRTSGGTLEDAIIANTVLLSNPGRPDSAKVVTSGTFGSRLGPATASTRILPSLDSGSVVDGDENIDCTSDVTSAIAAGIEPG